MSSTETEEVLREPIPDGSATLVAPETLRDAQGLPCRDDGKAWRSYSAVEQYNNCPYSFKRARIDKKWQKPAAWFPQGTAVHAGVEAYEKSNRSLTPEQMESAYLESWADECNMLLDRVPNTDFWFWSGPYDGERDLERRRELGKEQLTRYLTWSEKEGVPDTLDGELAVELPFETEFGGVPVRGVIDQVKKRRPLDVKSGNKPGKPPQLATYAGALRNIYDIPATDGSFWMGKTGKETFPVDLTEWTDDRLAELYGKADEGIKAESFDPDPEADKCRFCTVQFACPFRAD